MTTTSQKIAQDVAALLRARNPLLWIITREEARVEGYVHEAAAAAGYKCLAWDVAQGVTNREGRTQKVGRIEGDTLTSPDTMMDTIRDQAVSPDNSAADRCVWVMRDVHEWLGSGMLGASTLRRLRNLARQLPGAVRSRAQAVVLLTTSTNVPPELANHATVIEWPLPDRQEVAAMLDGVLENLPTTADIAEQIRSGSMKPEQGANAVTREQVEATLSREDAIDAAVGLSGEEIQATYAKSLVQNRCIDDGAVAQEKRRVIARERVLEWYDPLPGGLDAVGGLANLKTWLVSRRAAYTPEARAYGLPSPKGILLAGVPGCGKSLSAKAVATAWGVPLLRFDMAALRSKFVGDSEANIRKALRVAEAIGRCVLWLDEIEKALQGATSGSADGGVSADALGTLLSWMQERQGEVFVVATANDAAVLPPELLRKGRFDEVFFVDLPNADERAQVLETALRSHGRTVDGKVVNGVASATEGFTGSEVAELVPAAMFAAFADGVREVMASDLMWAVDATVPLSRTAPEKVEAMRKWGRERARPANAPMEIATPKLRRMTTRQVDL